MKKIMLVLIVGIGCLIYKPASAQVSVTVNIGSQPAWGPVGYDYVDYYYMPDIEVYYYVPTRRYIYLSNGKWIFAASLPSRYSYYNIYTGYKVVMNQPKPYLHFSTHKVTYAKYKGNNGRQGIIKNSNDPKYYVVKGHPKYNAAKSKTTVKKSKAPASKGNGGVAKGGGKGKGKN